MKKEELIEDCLVYTDNGIERVHWCNVNGVKELVSPKGKVYGYVPDYFEVKRLHEQLNDANELISLLFPISMNKERALERTSEYMERWGVK